MIITLNDVNALEPWMIAKPVVLACGCFDLLTFGHVRHLQQARKLGACLCVVVTADRHVAKGLGRPVFSQEARAEVIDALDCVDWTIINPYTTAVEAIRQLRPAVYVKGGEYREKTTPALAAEVEALKEISGRLEFTNAPEVHTTDVLRRLGLCA